MNTLHKTLVATLVAMGLMTGVASQAATVTVTMVKNKGCVCCERWAAAMRTRGFTVKSIDMADNTPYKDKLGVPATLRSCHTASAGGYVFEGHVPPDLVAKALKDKPAIAGLATPGMPAAAPGMDIAGASSPYQVMAFSKNGQSTVYAQR